MVDSMLRNDLFIMFGDGGETLVRQQGWRALEKISGMGPDPEYNFCRFV